MYPVLGHRTSGLPQQKGPVSGLRSFLSNSYLFYLRLNLELYQVKQVMTSPVETIKSREKVSRLCKLLLETTFGGFPVVKETQRGEVYDGVITRLERREKSRVSVTWLITDSNYVHYFSMKRSSSRARIQMIRSRS